MNTFANKDGAVITDKLILAIQQNKQYLSDIDGLIGDGDHGINMNINKQGTFILAFN
jgi:phosphoenolpyruvate---glycerone phosphotransferase subunit DhaL